MSLNEINTSINNTKNNPVKAYETINNNEKNSFTLEKVELNNPKADSFNASNHSVAKSNESVYYNSSSNTEGSKAITDTYMADIVKKGKEVPKPDNVEMDDVSWAYFYNKNILERGKNLIKDNLTANEYVKYKKETMNDKEYWDMVFEAKAKNEKYSVSTIEKSNTGLKLSADEFFSNKGNISVTKLSASSLHNVLMAFENEDVELFTYAINTSKTTDKPKTIAENQKQIIESYDAMQEYAQNALSPYEQLQIIKNNLKNGSLASYQV